MDINNSPKKEETTANNGFNSLEYMPDENGQYVKVQAKSFEPKNIALELVWDTINEQIEITRKKVLDGELSSLAYYMEKDQMSIKRIAYMTGIPKRKIRHHMDPEVFKTLKPEVLLLYASVFNIPVEQLLKIK